MEKEGESKVIGFSDPGRERKGSPLLWDVSSGEGLDKDGEGSMGKRFSQ